MTAAGYTPVPGEQLDLIRADPTTGIGGRFTAARLPPAVNGAYLRVVYEDNFVRLAASRSTRGFDTPTYPGDALMQSWIANSPYRWACYDLGGPCHQDISWLGHRAYLEPLGWGLLIRYVGQQPAGMVNCNQNTLTAGQAWADGADAIAKAANEGFAHGSWIYLDVEPSIALTDPQTGQLLPDELPPDMLTYVQSWMRALIYDGRYQPALYAHRKNIAQLLPATDQAFSFYHRRDRTRLWVTGGPPNGRQNSPPHQSDVPEALIWQYPPLNGAQTYGGLTVNPIDQNVSAIPNPSGPEPQRITRNPATPP